MNRKTMKQIFRDTDFVHRSGTPEELRAAEYLKAQCEALGVKAWLESFPVPMAEMEEARVWADGKEIPCRGFFNCGSGEVEGELYYMPGQDKVSIAGAKDKIVLMDTQGIGFFAYHDLMEAGAKAILFQYGNLHYPNRDIDERDLRSHVVGEERRVLCAMIHSESAVALVKNKVKRVRILIRQREYEGASHNVVAELPGRRDEWIVLSAHYDTTALSHGSYDNMSGCVGILGVLDALRGREHNYGLRLVFCGSEERGLLGSKAWVRDHEGELSKVALNVNLDMIGTIMGKFIAKVSAEDKLANYLSYMGAELGFPVEAKTGVYSSDSTPFADKGVPALSLARLASGNVAPIHCRYDRPDVLSLEQMQKDIAFIAEFTRRMADAALCPVSREIPEKVKKELDEYLFRKRKDN
jgi:Iap family predicted aminopeptidase